MWSTRLKTKKAEKIEISWKMELFRNPKKMRFPITTDFENRLKHQVSIISCAFLDIDLLVHILVSNAVHSATGSFHPFRTLPVSAGKFKFQ